MAYSDQPSHLGHLPDPQTQAEFYDSVPTKRLFAWVFDMVFTLLFALLMAPLTGFLAIFVFIPFYFIIGFCYRVITLSRGSATWGMRIMSIEIRDSGGRKLDFGGALLHTTGYTVSLMFMFLQVISIVLMLSTERRQGLSDHILGTVALNRRK